MLLDVAVQKTSDVGIRLGKLNFHVHSFPWVIKPAIVE